jgi:hypothetical protein
VSILIKNNAGSFLASGISDSDLSLTVGSGDGSLFPDTSGGGYFYATLIEGLSVEIVKVTSRATDVFTIVRAQDGSTAKVFTPAARIEQRWNKAQIEETIQDHATPKIYSIPNATGIISIVFASPRVDANYVAVPSFECDDPAPIFLQWIIHNKTASGFSVLLNAPTDSANYKMHYTLGNAI